MSSDSERLLYRVKQVLKLVTLTVKQQQSYFPQYIYLPEAIISSIYDDALIYIPQIKFLCTASAYESLLKFELMVNSFMKNKTSEFDIAELISDEWIEIQNVAENILDEFGEGDRLPDDAFI